MPDKSSTQGIAPHLALVGVQVMFGTWPIVGKVVLRAISSTGLVALRVGGAAIALTLLHGRLGKLRQLPRKDLAWLFFISLLGVVWNQLLYVKGLSLTTAINATLLSTTIPVCTLVISVALSYDRLSLRRLAGIALAAAGVIYLVNPLRADFSGRTLSGNLLIIANSMCYGAYIALSKDLFKRYGALNVITWVFVIASFLVVPIGLFDIRSADIQSITPVIWAAVVYTILIPTVAAYYLNAWALARVAPSTVAAYIYLQPLIAFGLAPLVLGEQWNSRTILACLLIFGGVAVVTMPGRSKAAKEVAERPDALAH
ncbi:MAG TPA: DMT family transporter [Pyrinomonadaceae bacterium]|nr:DMT family transporter [Pyrinomonadaceae bacterium]